MAVRFRVTDTVTPRALRVANDNPWVAAQTTNVGVGGAFIASPAIQSIGATLSVELSLPGSDQVFTLPAVVRWVDGANGMGVQFVGVDVDILLELNDYFSSLTGA